MADTGFDRRTVGRRSLPHSRSRPQWRRGVVILIFTAGTLFSHLTYAHAQQGLAAAKQRELTCWEALQDLAQRMHASLVCADLPEPPKAFLLDNQSLLLSMAEMEDAYGVEIGWWRGIIIARERVSASLEERLRGSLTADESALLLRLRSAKPDGDTGHDFMVNAVRMLLHGAPKSQDRELLLRAACYLAGPYLYETMVHYDAARSGRSFVRFSEVYRSRGREDPCHVHLLENTPIAGLDPRYGLYQTWEFHGPESSFFHRELKARGGLISVTEYADRVVRAERKTVPVWEHLRAAEVAAPVGEYGSTLGEVVKAIVGDTVPCSVPAAVASRPLRCVIRENTLAEVLRAFGVVTGTEVLPAASGRGTVEFRAPGSLRSRVENALPLSLWAIASSPPMAQRWIDDQLRKECFQRLTASARDQVTRGSHVDDLPLAAALCVRTLIGLRAGTRLTTVLGTLPPAGAPVPLVLYEHPDDEAYELAAPVGSEVLQGWRYYLLKQERTGRSLLVRTIPPVYSASARP